MRTTIRTACLLVAAVLVAALPAAADAATKKITLKPNALTPFTSQQDDQRSGIFNGGDGVRFWASLKLPVGAKITGLSYRRWATTTLATDVSVDRVQPGKSPAWQRICIGEAFDVSPAGSTGTTVNGAFTGQPKKVESGWNYFVHVFTNPGAFVGDITVKYETP